MKSGNLALERPMDLEVLRESQKAVNRRGDLIYDFLVWLKADVGLAFWKIKNFNSKLHNSTISAWMVQIPWLSGMMWWLTLLFSASVCCIECLHINLLWKMETWRNSIPIAPICISDQDPSKRINTSCEVYMHFHKTEQNTLDFINDTFHYQAITHLFSVKLTVQQHSHLMPVTWALGLVLSVCNVL